MRARLEPLLHEAAQTGEPLTYAEMAGQLELEPPHTIHRTAMMLEELMRAQAQRGEPHLASFVISRARGGLPAPGFFALMRELGLYHGADTGEAAEALVARERRRCAEALIPHPSPHFWTPDAGWD